jgi:tetratricopeptide (TPR) repeat protein
MPDPDPEKPVGVSLPSQNETVSPRVGGISDLKVSVPPTAIDAPSHSPDVANEQSRYRIKKFHARGGMGEIWVSEDSRLGREVALKKLSIPGQHAKERFLAEAQVAGQLEHPGIVPVHDVGLDEQGNPFYIMKFVRGQSLKKEIEDYYAQSPDQGAREVQWRGLLQIFVHLCQAVAYTHSRGVLHRDLKPENIMLGPYGETMLLDWGLARVRGQPDLGDGSSGVRSGSSTQETAAGSILGSPLYMAPEMAEGRMADIDERTDIYLLGATLYEILTGRPPREGRSRDEIIALARTARPPPPRTLRRDLPKPLEAICLKALAHRKLDRYSSALNLAQDVQRYLAGEPVSAFPENLLARTWRWTKRHRRALGRTAAALLVLVAALFTVVMFRQIEQRQQESRREAAHLQELEQTRTQIQNFDELADEARFYAASTDPITEHAPYYDPDKARIAASAALAAATNWGPGLQQLAIPQQSERLRSELYELLLLMAQDQLQSSKGPPSGSVAALLDQAAGFMPEPSRGYYRLRSRYFQLQDDPNHAAEMSRLALDSQTPSTAFDYFLLGEECRRRSSIQAQPSTTNQSLSPSQTKDLSNAIEAYRKALRIDPKHYWSHFQLGRCYLSLGKWSEAVEALGACIALRPEAPWGYSARGMTLGLMHRFDEAKEDLDHAIAISPDFRPARLNRGVVNWLQQDRPAALADFTAALQPPEGHRLIEAAYYRAQIFVQSKDYDRALDDLNAFISEEKDFIPAYLLRARVHLLQGNQAFGLQDLNNLSKVPAEGDSEPASAEAFGSRGRMLRLLAAQLPNEPARKTPELASQDLEKAIQLGGRSAQIYADLGAVRDDLGQNDSALAAYSAAIQLNPQDAQIRINRAWAYQKLGNYDRARTDFSTVLRGDSTSAEAHAGLGYVEACQKSYDDANEEAARALLYGGSDYLILHDVACIYAQISETDLARQSEYQDLAIAMLRRALDLWRSRTSGPDELQFITHEPAFSPSLRARPDFHRLSSNVNSKADY